MEDNWNRLQQINEYLDSKKADGIQAFQALIRQTASDNADMVIITFTYEYMEVAEKVKGQFKRVELSPNPLNRYEIEDLASYDYDETDSFEDYQYTVLGDLQSKLIDWWVAACFSEAIKINPTNIPFYFKQSHDGLEILDLLTCELLYERTEIETFVRNNQKNMMQLLGSE